MPTTSDEHRPPPRMSAGAEKYMPDVSTPVGSAATDAIITAAKDGDRPL